MPHKFKDVSLAEYLDAKLETLFNDGHIAKKNGALYDSIVTEVEKPLLIKTLTYTQGHQIKAAEILGLNRNTLRTKLKAHKIDSTKFKKAS